MPPFPRTEKIHAAYPRLEADHRLPVASRALPVCYAHDGRRPMATVEPRTYELARVTCLNCRRVVARFAQLPRLLELAREVETRIQ